LPQGKPRETEGRKATGVSSAIILSECQPAAKGLKTCGENCNGSKKCSKKYIMDWFHSPLTLSFQWMMSLEFFFIYSISTGNLF